MMEENKCNSSAAAGGDRQEEAGNGLDRLDLYHVELTGMCTDQDLPDYARMLAEFAQKFSSFVEL